MITSGQIHTRFSVLSQKNPAFAEVNRNGLYEIQRSEEMGKHL